MYFNNHFEREKKLFFKFFFVVLLEEQLLRLSRFPGESGSKKNNNRFKHRSTKSDKKDFFFKFKILTICFGTLSFKQLIQIFLNTKVIEF